MKKGNNILFTISVIALGLLPFYAFNASALYIKTDDPITIGISGSIGADTYTVNLYKPSSDGTYSISNTVEDLSGTTTLDSVITSSSIDLTTPIDNKYIFSSSWYSSAELNSTTVTTSTLSTLDDNDGTVDKTVNVYAGYYGYYAIGTTYNGSEHSIKDTSKDQQLSVSSYNGNNYVFNNDKCVIETSAVALYRKLLGKESIKDNYEHLGKDYTYESYADWNEEKRCQCNSLYTSSGIYKIGITIKDGKPYDKIFKRYIKITVPQGINGINWFDENAKIVARPHSSANYDNSKYWIEMNAVSGENFTFDTYINVRVRIDNNYYPYNYLQFERYNPVQSGSFDGYTNLWNKSQSLDIEKKGYSQVSYKAIYDSGSEWNDRSWKFS